MEGIDYLEDALKAMNTGAADLNSKTLAQINAMNIELKNADGSLAGKYKLSEFLENVIYSYLSTTKASSLASVLGVQIKTVGSTNLNYNSDFNNCTASPNCVSFYIVPSGAANKPDSSWLDGFVITFGWINDNYFMQFAFGKTGIYYRAYIKSTGFESWVRL